MEKILADDFVLVTGRGKAFTKASICLAEARGGTRLYERPGGDDAEGPRLRRRRHRDRPPLVQGHGQGKPFDYKLWFSNGCVRTPAGWKYVFGQASLTLP